MPFFLEAAILSRIRSPVTSRSNWANDRRMLSVRRPIDDVVLNCWVTDTKETACRSKMSTILLQEPLESRPFQSGARKASVVVHLADRAR